MTRFTLALEVASEDDVQKHLREVADALGSVLAMVTPLSLTVRLYDYEPASYTRTATVVGEWTLEVQP